MINVLPSKNNFIAYVGMNTMPVYIFHLTLRYVIQFYGLYIGFISCLVVAWFALLSLSHKKHQNNLVYGATIVVSIVAFYFMFSSGVLAGLIGGCPETQILFNLLVYGGALICGVSFVSPFWIKLYDLIIDGPARLPYLTKWLMGPNYEEQK